MHPPSGLQRLRHYQPGLAERRCPGWKHRGGLSGAAVHGLCGSCGGLAPIPLVCAAILPPMLLYVLIGFLPPAYQLGPESPTALMTAAGDRSVAAGDPATYAALASLLAADVGLVCCMAP